jgi:hypothetical protein
MNKNLMTSQLQCTETGYRCCSSCPGKAHPHVFCSKHAWYHPHEEPCAKCSAMADVASAARPSSITSILGDALRDNRETSIALLARATFERRMGGIACGIGDVRDGHQMGGGIGAARVLDIMWNSTTDARAVDAKTNAIVDAQTDVKRILELLDAEVLTMKSKLGR